MTKNLLKESILPAFWLFFFIASSKSEVKIKDLRKADNTELKIKKQDISAGSSDNTLEKNKELSFTKAVYITGY